MTPLLDAAPRDREALLSTFPLRPSTLVGSYALADDGSPAVVVAEPSPNLYLVQPLTWPRSGGDMLSAARGQTLVAIEAMAGWTFFDTAAQLRAAWSTV